MTHVVAATISVRGVMPPGIQPPVVGQFAASSEGENNPVYRNLGTSAELKNGPSGGENW